jgi:hypothetical protein
MIYFSQNDPQWKNVKIGKSNSTLGSYGCTISCIATGGTWFGEEKNPGSLAGKLRFLVDKVLWASIGEVYKNMKFSWRFYKYDQGLIDEALKNKDKVVLLNISGGAHWVFGRYKIPLFGYMTQDPYPYPSKMRRVSAKEIVGGAILVKK